MAATEQSRLGHPATLAEQLLSVRPMPTTARGAVNTAGPMHRFRASAASAPKGQTMTSDAALVVRAHDPRNDPGASAGPDAGHSPTSKSGVGFTSPAALAYRGKASGVADVTRYFPDIANLRIAARQELRYAVFPEWRDSQDVLHGFAADAVALDLLFSDGTRLSALHAVDQHGIALDPLTQHRGCALHPDQWNLVRVNLDRAIGRTVACVELRYVHTAPGTGIVQGWLDTVSIRETRPVPRRPVERVRTRQGSMSSPRVSRGNTVPAVVLPNAFVTGIPVTNADSYGWPYSWHADNRDDNRPAIQAFATSHLPSPWMGDRGAFQIMPVPTEGVPPDAPEDRALGFEHEAESAHPHCYRVHLDGGIDAELTAAEHTVLARFRFPIGTTHATIVFDQIEGRGGLRLPRPDAGRKDAVVTAYSDDALDGHGDRDPTPRAFLYAQLNRPAVAVGALAPKGRDACGEKEKERSARGWVRVALAADREVVVRLATSFIGVEQAAANLVSDGADASFETVCERAAAAWDDWIDRVRVDGASAEQQMQLATALYRVGMFPRRAHENLGTPESPKPHYASPFHRAGAATPEATGSRVLPGELSVDHGFWDVYRTAWPLYALLDPPRTSRLLDGFAEHYRAGGWSSRWAAPGPVDSMTGTSNDVVFAYAVDSGAPVRLGGRGHHLNLWDAYESALRNATVPSPRPSVGRKGIETSQFRGWVDTSIAEGLGWTLDGSINDTALAGLAAALLERIGAEHPRRDELETAAEFFTVRAGYHRNVFDPATGFYLGRHADGRFRAGPQDFDPAIWGHDYTETNGWGTAFSAPHDGAGLAQLLGGPQKLAERLDRFLSTPEHGDDSERGSYPSVIHEMTEARNQRLGMLALSNQPAHHIPFMALFAGRPDVAQDLVRTAVERLFVGGEIGQGWPGDEDNGEMSAWWVFAMLGLYPLVPARAGYVITSPLLPRAVIRLNGGAELVIEAPGADREHRYIAAVRVDGESWTSTFIPHARIAGGARIRIDLATTPQSWGRGAPDQPPSLTQDGRLPSRVRDLTPLRSRSVSSTGDPTVVLDDSSVSGSVRLKPEDWIQIDFDEPVRPRFYTVTPVAPGIHAWRWAVEQDGAWIAVERRSEQFRWERQTRPFRIEIQPARRWRLIAETPLDLAQLELLERSEAE